MSTIISFEFQEPFFRFFLKELSVKEFENWLYFTKPLENILGERYFDLIILDFREYKIIENVKKIITPVLDFHEFEKREIRYLLENILLLDDDFPVYLKIIHDLHYPFMTDLLMNIHALAFECGLYYDKNWRSYSSVKRAELVANFYDIIQVEVAKLLSQIDHYEVGTYISDGLDIPIPRNKQI